MASSFSTGFVMGCMVGAIGHYCVHLFLSSDTNKVKQNEQRDVLNNLFNTYPVIMERFKVDFSDPENATIREFFVVDKTAIMNSSVPRLRYDLSEEIMPVLNELEALGYIHTLPNDSLLYQMNDEFLYQLKNTTRSENTVLL